MHEPPRIRFRAAALALAGAIAALGAAGAVSAQSPRPGFGLFAAAFVDSLHRPHVRVTAEVPFHNLVFFKRHDRYTADWQVFLEVRNARGDSLVGTWVISGSATVRRYEDTRRRGMRARAWRVIDLRPGDYRMHARVAVRGTRITMEREIVAHVPDFVTAGMGFTTPRIVYVRPGDVVPFARWSDVSARAHPASDDSLDAAFDREPLVRFGLYLEPASGQPVDGRVAWAVRDARGELVRYGRHPVHIRGRDDEWCIGLRVDDWPAGRYRVELSAEAGERRARASVEFRVDVTRAMLTTGFDDTVEMLRIVYGDDDALRALREAPRARRLAAWRAFWDAHDPDPTTPNNEALREFLDRVDTVLERFSDTEPGWRTDRGRVFLRFGPPDRIERAPDQRNRGEYEIWRYFDSGRTFVFYDMFGLGDFRLVEGDVF